MRVVNEYEISVEYALLCLCVCVCVCVFIASDSSETIKAIVIKLGTLTASDMSVNHVLIILTLAFIQGHTVYLRLPES